MKTRQNYAETVRKVAAQAGKSYMQISKELGRANTYLSSTLNSGRTPSVENYATMLHVCGYELAAIPADAIPADAILIAGNESSDTGADKVTT